MPSWERMSAVHHLSFWFGNASVSVQMDSRAALLLQAGLEAASVLIRLCAAESCPQALLQEAALDTVCALIAEVTNGNLLAFFNAAVRQDVRPDLHGMPLRVRFAFRHNPGLAVRFLRCLVPFHFNMGTEVVLLWLYVATIGSMRALLSCQAACGVLRYPDMSSTLSQLSSHLAKGSF